MRKTVTLLLALTLALGLTSTAWAGTRTDAQGRIWNEDLDNYAALYASYADTDLWLIDAYGNRLDNNTVTIAKGGTFAVWMGSTVQGGNPFEGDLFGNVGWNLDTLAASGITYSNFTDPTVNNGHVGFTLDADANSGRSVPLDIYIVPNPVDWSSMTTNYFVKRVIQIRVVAGVQSTTAAHASAAFKKPVPDYTLSVTANATATASNMATASDLAYRGLALTLSDAGTPYPVVNNEIIVTMDIPAGMEGKDYYYVSYMDGSTLKEHQLARVVNGRLQVVVSHFSAYMIEGSDSELYPGVTAKTASFTPGAGRPNNTPLASETLTAPKTFDAGIGVYAALGMLSALGLGAARKGKRAEK